MFIPLYLHCMRLLPFRWPCLTDSPYSLFGKPHHNAFHAVSGSSGIQPQLSFPLFGADTLPACRGLCRVGVALPARNVNQRGCQFFGRACSLFPLPAYKCQFLGRYRTIGNLFLHDIPLPAQGETVSLQQLLASRTVGQGMGASVHHRFECLDVGGYGKQPLSSLWRLPDVLLHQRSGHGLPTLPGAGTCTRLLPPPFHGNSHARRGDKQLRCNTAAIRNRHRGRQYTTETICPAGRSVLKAIGGIRQPLAIACRSGKGNRHLGTQHLALHQWRTEQNLLRLGERYAHRKVEIPVAKQKAIWLDARNHSRTMWVQLAIHLLPRLQEVYGRFYLRMAEESKIISS